MNTLSLLFLFFKLWYLVFKKLFSNVFTSYVQIRLENIALHSQILIEIEKLHKENPTLSVEKLHEQIKLQGVANAPTPNTIVKYIKKMANKPKPPTEKQVQS